MKLNLLTLLSLILLIQQSFGQSYSGNWDARKRAISITNKAIDKLDSKDIDAAFAYLSEAISVDSLFLSPYQDLYKVLLENQIYSDSIIKLLEKGTRIFQEDDQLLFSLAEAYRFSGNIDNAIHTYSLAIKYSKKWGEDFYLIPYYYFNRGNCNLKQGHIELAKKDYDYSLKLKPDFSAVLINRGICHFKLKDKQSACIDWQRASDLGLEQAEKYILEHCK